MYPVEPTTRMLTSLGILFLKVEEEEEEEDDVSISEVPRDETGSGLDLVSLRFELEARGNEFNC